MSIITPVYNGSDTLGECLNSVKSQTYPYYEWILVDDCSTDSSVEIIKGWKNNRVRLIQRNENAGRPSVSRNEGCRAGKGKYLALLDQDDLWNPDKLESQVYFLEAHPDVALLGGNLVIIGTKSHQRNGDSMSRKQSFFPSAEFIYRRNPFLASSTIFRKDTFDDVNGFDETPCLVGKDDWELWIRIALGNKVYVDDGIVGQYRLHEENLSHQINNFAGTDYVRSKLGSFFSLATQEDVLARDHYKKGKKALKRNNSDVFRREITKAVKIQKKYFIKGLFLKVKSLLSN